MSWPATSRHRRLAVSGCLGVLLLAMAAFRLGGWGQRPTAEQARPAATLPLAGGHALPLPAAARGLRWERVVDFQQPLAVFPSVFWEPDDSLSLRELIRHHHGFADASIFEVGTGSGLIALCCLQAGARSVLATDVNPNAVACARWNATALGLESRLEVRLVETDLAHPYRLLDPSRKFDAIISNPPWEEGQPKSIDQFALYDPDFALLRNLIVEARPHLKSGGALYLAYGCKTAIRRVAAVAVEDQWEVEYLDERNLETLDELFLPGLLMRLRPRGTLADQTPGKEQAPPPIP
jgi:release factor glutamine methyltransferase